MPAFSGKCLCGAVQYKGDAEPVFAGNCHCTDCRKVSGGGHASVMAVPDAAVEITGEVKAYTLKADSGATVMHHFCPTCSTQIYHTSSSMDGMVMVIATSLDDPEIFQPQMSVFASSAVSWDQPKADIPQFPKMPPMGD